MCLGLTCDNQSVYDAGFIQHPLDVVVVQRECLSFPTLRVHQEHHPTRAGHLAHQHPYNGENVNEKLKLDCYEHCFEKQFKERVCLLVYPFRISRTTAWWDDFVFCNAIKKRL